MQHALLLQGPVGPFFRRFGDELRAHGTKVTKVNFNAGDGMFYRRRRDRDVISFDGKLDAWPEVFRKIVTERGIDAIFLFGDCRAMHVAAVQIARELGIAVWVFEEGYLRPNYVTLERGGVNGHSSLPRDAAFYREATAGLPAAPEPVAVGNTFGIHALWTMLYAFALTFGFWLYPRYRHHRRQTFFYGIFCWTRGGLRKLRYKFRDRGAMAKLIADHDGRYLVVPLQVHCDSQLLHSDFASMEQFIDEVVRTFAASAPADDLLVIKHHPHDTPFRDYTRYLRDLGQKYGCGARLRYVHDLHLPTLLRHARGVVTMNSTVGISALHHRAPVKALGRAIYAFPGLTSQRTLAEFFRDPGKVDHDLYERFVAWLRVANQVNGSFYKRASALGTVSGLDPVTFVTRPRVEPPVTLQELERSDHAAP